MHKIKLVLHPEFESLRSFAENLPDTFGASGDIVYQARNCLKKFSVNNEEVVVKSFKKPHIINRIAYTFFRKSKAERSYEYSLRLLEEGIGTPEPVGYIEVRSFGLLSKSYFINRYASGYQHIREQMFGRDIPDGFFDGFVSLISKMHNKGILHKDLSPGNVLFKVQHNKIDFKVIDINRMAFKERLTFDERCENFCRLTQNNEILSAIADKYISENNMNTRETMEKIFWYNKKFFG